MKFFGVIGYGIQTETAPSVWDDVITEHEAYGDVITNGKGIQSSDKVNDDITMDVSLSIMMDAYSTEHFFAMRYAKWQGAFWKIAKVTPERPRLILRLGGVYHGPFPTPKTDLEQRTEFDDILKGILPDGWSVYFQPKSNVVMQYPCVRYERDFEQVTHANNALYNHKQRYQVTVIDRNPDSPVKALIRALPLSAFRRFFVADNLNHDVYIVYY